MNEDVPIPIPDLIEFTFEEKRIQALNTLSDECNPTCSCDNINCYSDTKIINIETGIIS